jgi:hypothetical protein
MLLLQKSPQLRYNTSGRQYFCYSLFAKATRFRCWCGNAFCNKILSGHSVIAGALITKSVELGKQLHFQQFATGATLGPMDSF